MSKLDLIEKNIQTEFNSYLEKSNKNYTESTMYDYFMRIKRVCERENLTWQELSHNIKEVIIKYDKNGVEEKYGQEGNGSVISALKIYERFVKNNNYNFIIVDLFSGAHSINNVGHEIFNQVPNTIDGKFYGYVPKDDNPNIEKLGATNNDSHVDDILVVFVTKEQNSNNRIVTGFYPKATVYRNKILDRNLNRTFIDNDGSIKTATYSIKSDEIIKVSENNSYLIITERFNKWMFRKQRVYGGTYPILDIELLDFIKNYKSISIDDDFNDQEIIQTIEQASNKVVADAPKIPLVTDVSSGVLKVRRNQKLSKTAIINSGFLCEYDDKHQTFINSNNNTYMEGHHLIPCTLSNAREIWEKFNRNIDCVENIVSLCPNCHRKIHFGNKESKEKILTKLFNNQNHKLQSIGIYITKEELFGFYGV